MISLSEEAGEKGERSVRTGEENTKYSISTRPNGYSLAIE